MQCCVNLPMYEEKLKASIQLAKDYAVSHGKDVCLSQNKPKCIETVLPYRVRYAEGMKAKFLRCGHLLPFIWLGRDCRSKVKAKL